MDGSGYPDGLRGEAIPLKARILQVADNYDALTTDRLMAHRSSECSAYSRCLSSVMITIAITFAGHVFAIWDQVFTLLKFQVFALFLFRHFHPN
jgi:hypothetical protein